MKLEHKPIQLDENLVHRLRQQTNGAKIHEIAQHLTIYFCGVELYNRELAEQKQLTAKMLETQEKINTSVTKLRDIDQAFQKQKLEALLRSAPSGFSME